MTPKLVRDRIPELISAHGERPRTRRLDDKEYVAALHDKLQEECQEYLSANTDVSAVEELADVMEVVRALAAVHGASPEALEVVRAEKAARRGGFLERIYLIDVE
ncbi:nucleoside triphosphate pyrophosphohydrolase [Sulfobacillus harzensis]|uniref:Nucleoside triphosphate pyrophosphohydrolase n=1 Tax=Sulfobacillus harzensis TaxID=2729629 RepID=A0A7Y0Q449_9FIRM|nr:nucleoside triphosphate pyrophosphohydrolase [Sulfobacillus harzensis]NMP23641.1 nucleoside triphosphate pyrophosphohydrolase [Sulfobacillus harzensis]